MDLLHGKESIHFLLMKLMKAYMYLTITENLPEENKYFINIDLLNEEELSFHNDKIDIKNIKHGLIHLFD